MRHLLIPLVVVASVAAQTPEPTFEVASVKPNKTGAPGGSYVMPPGRFTATNIPLKVPPLDDAASVFTRFRNSD